MTGNPEKPGAVDTRLLLEVMKSTAAAALAMSEPTQVGTTSAGDSPASTEQPRHVTEENKRLILEVLKATAESTRTMSEVVWTMAEASRIGATITERAVIAGREGGRQSGVNGRHTAAPIKPEEPLVKIPPIAAGRGSVPGGGPFVINERVGAITVAAWEGLSEGRLKEIDDGLKDIVKVCSGLGSLESIALAIQEKLAAIGLQFATSTYFPTAYDGTHWERSKKTELSELTKVLALGDFCMGSCTLGTSWYSDEMVRVLQRLMELRGFKT